MPLCCVFLVDINCFMPIEERIYQELIHEQAALWFISDDFGAKIMVKAPSSTIKAIMKGCRVEFLFGKDCLQNPPIFHHAVRIYDDPVHYMTISGTHRYPDEHASLAAIMGRSYTHIHFHNELSICVATATVSFPVADQMKVLNLQGNLQHLYCGPFDQKASVSLDRFGYKLKMETPSEEINSFESIIIEEMIRDWTVMKNHIIGSNENNKIIFNDAKEGNTFEQEIWAPLNALFGTDAHRNAKIFDKNKFRELTDVFAHYEDGLFLIESKALGVVNSSGERSMGRKVAGVQKQITTGIGQVVGAWKKILANKPVYHANEKDVVFEYSGFKSEALPHCIVLVSELLPFGDWKHIEMMMFEAMIQNRIYLNVMDLREFMQYIGHARGSKDQLNLMLIERVECLVKNQSIHMTLNVIKEKKI